MTETLHLLAARRSVPANALGEPAPSQDELDRMLTVAARVPDHGKLAPWRFIVIEGEGRAELGARLAALMKEIDPETPEAKVQAQSKVFSQSALVVAVVSRAAPHVKIPEWEQVLSAGAVCMNLSIAATALGYGAQWLTGWAAYEKRALEALGLQPGERIAGFIHIGAPTERWPDRPRPALSDVVTRWRA
ncbi:nitroreductase family protein [Hansschlegelia plantiphila]|uniref:Putative NAD(P)H nitroreductase n=1 Tax=Hansschlegelia plantiphila TaxID=374655 RepID=A0A9W6MV03_9HYPH|nr:nitroreductase [Hansschlegelia plantiphila]GLK67944.1 nitroreductase [Hansschlegelia plantiphila]